MSLFTFIMPTFNARSTIERSILSVATQTHTDWRIIIRDDMSTDGTPEIIETFSKNIGIWDKIHLTVNSEKYWEVKNIVKSLDLIEDKEIVCRLDGDDWLTDCDALTIIDNAYSRTGAGAIWTAHRWGFTHQNISGPLPKDADPYKHPWVSSHLKTFRKSMISSVNDDNFRSSDGQYYKRIGDQAIYLPVLRNCAGNWHFEPFVAYHYTIDMRPETFQTQDAKFQRDEALHLRTRGYVK